VIDAIDHDDADSISAAGIIPLVTGTIMRTKEDRTRLAKETIEFGFEITPKRLKLDVVWAIIPVKPFGAEKRALRRIIRR
jgi:hypothetical protein